ncbi:Uncharacterised protein [Vibrio cholerae]|nr:Uncharacterised protein [Vibrio cholerae]CSI48805.1 Uncharacterised protein [Vibrio cholerae]
MQIIAAHVGSNQPIPYSKKGRKLNAETSKPATFAASSNATSRETDSTARYATRGFGSL